ncbi:HAD family hydrolase [Amycolatopsis sp. GM8]|uniref:HAD-IIIC family phosphatase n=1 Tax=Amycolatopsis sp. GM8 TaxID=2896530 RepID=UPI001F23C3A8|nr:HAD-IIIC family phosphatase [Amycolatopsis sp. GM8]
MTGIFAPGGAATGSRPKRGQIKCVVWDLDNTLWDGTLLEDGNVRLRDDVVAEIRRLDRLGVLHSVASKNDEDAALAKLREFGVEELFLHPQISWNAKSDSLRRVAEAINIGIDALAFVDDQEFERAEVAAVLPEVTCVDAADLPEALREARFQPRFVTDESARRRDMYRSQIVRDERERDFVGTSEDFLATLDMTLVIAPAAEADLQRAEELTVRTNQLNSTGVTYSYEELDALRGSPDHLLLVASLTDKFGSYGKIGVCLVEKGDQHWYLRLLLMSCRVMSRGVGTILLGHVMNLAAQAGKPLRADFVETGRNRMMQITYAFAGFTEVGRDGANVVLQSTVEHVQEPPSYVRVILEPTGEV